MKPPAPCVFAIPGDIDTLTGGFIYERRLLLELRKLGHDVQHMVLPAGFPDPTRSEMAAAVTALQAVAPTSPIILDGLVFGSIASGGLATVKAPVIAMVHHPLALESELATDRRAHLFATEYANLRLAAHILVPSPHTRDILIDRYDVAADQITIAPPGTDPPSRPSVPVSPPLILSVGILHPRKGHDILLAALDLLPDLEWRAVIVGNPWDAGHARKLARDRASLKVASRITLAGLVSDDVLDKFYAQASVFALATRYEGYGIVFDEALSRGLPIVSCRVGAVPDTVPEAASLLVPPEDAHAFADALRLLLADDKERRIRADAAARAGRMLPGWDRTAANASGAIQQLCAGQTNG